MSQKSSQDMTKEGQYLPERVKFRVSDSWKYSKYSKTSMCDHLLKAATSYPISYHQFKTPKFFPINTLQ